MYDLPSRTDVGKVRDRPLGRAREGQPHARARVGDRRASSVPAAPRPEAPAGAPRMDLADGARVSRRARQPRDDRRRPPLARPRSSACSASCTSSVTLSTQRPSDPHHRHERQGLDRPDRSPACWMAHGLTVGTYTSPHLRADQRAHRRERRADRRRRPGRSDRERSPMLEALAGVEPVLLRDPHRRRLPVVRRHRRRCRRRRGRPARPLGRHERAPTVRSPSSRTSALDHTEYAGPTRARHRRARRRAS